MAQVALKVNLKLEDLLRVIGRKEAWGWMVEWYLPAGPACPSCGSAIEGRSLQTFFSFRRTSCRACSRVFTPTAGTPIHDTSWQPEEYVSLLALHLAGRKPAEIAQHLVKHQATIREMLDKVALWPDPCCHHLKSGSISQG